MIEVNFFEKKARNVLPHLMVLVLFVGLLGIGVYFFLMHGLYVSQHNQNTQIIQQQSEEVAFARELQTIDRTTNQNEQTIITVENDLYPIVFLTEDIVGLIPDSAEAVDSFTLTEGTSLLLQLNQSVIGNSADLIVSFEAVPYISRVQLNRFEQLGEDEGHLIELTLIIDEDILREEAVQ